MDASIGLERCLEFIRSQSQPVQESRLVDPATAHRHVVTISRQAGSGAHLVAEELIERLDGQAPAGSTPWTVFDRNLVEKVLEEHDLPGRLARFMPEDRVSEIADTLDELFGLRPSSWTLVRKTAETILHLAELGNVVIIGRGGNIITNRLGNAFHVRLVGSVEKRIERLRDYKHLDQKAASECVRDEDSGRKRYVEKYYAKDIDDPLLYHLVINTDRMSDEETARIIAEVLPLHPNGSEPIAADASRKRARVLG
jgi:cytidylate kinase